MRSTWAVLGGCLLASAAVWAADDGAVVKDVRIAVVDIAQVFKEYRHALDMRKEWADSMRTYSNRIESLQRRTAQIRAEAREYAAGTPENLARQEELNEKLKELRALQTEAAAASNAAWVKMLRTLYAEMNDAIRAYAQENKIDLVIKQQSLSEYSQEDMKELTREGMILEISRRTVLFHDPRLDISEPVVKRLNDAYQKRQAEKAVEPKPGSQAPAPKKEAKP